ncbi:cytochrome c1 [Henriciella barbarensis]|uniref:Cytochrome c1 n=2 Tax=Henriciella barbarensis TaxID=86342 RepID=A0A399R7Y9_9PROT|nr:cytochrome c1 [Henriciella barbarensis]
MTALPRPLPNKRSKHMKFLRFISAGLGAAAIAATAQAAGGSLHAHEPEGGWAFEGPVGELDMASVQRGYQVYREVCAACHSMRLLSYRNLGEPGGPFYDPEYPNANNNPLVKSFAAQDEILSTEPNDVGDYDFRPARTSDPFKSPYPNDAAARAANGGALPPDLSVITKARHGGASYIYSLISGYPSEDVFSTREIPAEETPAAESEAEAEGEGAEAVDGGEMESAEAAAPAGPTSETVLKVSEIDSSHYDFSKYKGELVQPVGQYYNPYMAGDVSAQWRGDPRKTPPGGFLAMPPQLSDGRVSYLDGTEATVEQMSIDIANFLQWAGEPKQSQRKSTGLAVMIYLLIFAVLLWFSFHRIWRNVKH